MKPERCPVCRKDPAAHGPSGLCVGCYVEWTCDADELALKRLSEDGREANADE